MSYFNENLNPFMKMFNELSIEQQEEYKKKGKDLYEFINFETGELYEKNPSYLDIDSIKRCLQSGMSEDDLTEQEKEILNNNKTING